MKQITLRELYNHDIRKVNAIATSAAFDFSLLEEKLVDYISTLISSPITKENGEITYQTVYEISYNHFCKCIGVKPDNKIYQNIDQAIKNLKSKVINLILPNKAKTGVAILDRYEINDRKKKNSATAIIQLDDRMIPILISKTKNYFSHKPEYTLLMNSKYSIRLYQWLLALLNKEIGKNMKYSKFGDKEIPMNLVELIQLDNKAKKLFLQKKEKIEHKQYEFAIYMDAIKYQLSISKSYRGYETIKDKILEKTVKEINSSTDIQILSYEYDQNDDCIVFIITRKNTFERIAVDTYLEEKINIHTISTTEVSKEVTGYIPGEIKDIDKINKWIEAN